MCHQLADEFFCPDCPRVYHNKCFKKIKSHLSEQSCECKLSSIEGLKPHPNISGDLKGLLELVLQKVVEEKNNVSLYLSMSLISIILYCYEFVNILSIGEVTM